MITLYKLAASDTPLNCFWQLVLTTAERYVTTPFVRKLHIMLLTKQQLMSMPEATKVSSQMNPSIKMAVRPRKKTQNQLKQITQLYTTPIELKSSDIHYTFLTYQ
jgi:hypothetical protein